MADDDYSQTTVRIFRVDQRRLAIRQLTDRTPGEPKRSFAELIHEAVDCLEHKDEDK